MAKGFEIANVFIAHMTSPTADKVKALFEILVKQKLLSTRQDSYKNVVLTSPNLVCPCSGLSESLKMTVSIPFLWGIPPEHEVLSSAVRNGGGIVDKVYRQWLFASVF